MLNIIKHCIDPNKSPGYDNIPALLIKWSANHIIPVLIKLFNTFTELGKYPDFLKIAKVTALFKGGDRLKRDNYRPISVLTHINTIFEKLIHERLSEFVKKHDILINSQYGFRKGHSTSHGITHLHENIIKSIEKQKICAALFIDLKSAFDTIDPNILVSKLDHYGVRGKALQLLHSYLSDRKQLIKCNDIESQLLNVLCGVPQGSVLGPLLFILYINDLAKYSRLDTLLFADDAVLTSSHESPKSLQKSINGELKKLHHWFITNKLTLNLDKTKFMLFHKKRNLNQKLKKFKVNINNYSIKQVCKIKYLGVILDNKLNWNDHINFVSTKLAQTAGIIYKVRNKVPQKVLLRIYDSIGAHYLRYGVASWGSAKNTALDKLRIIQNKIIRYLTHSSRFTNVQNHYETLGILKLDDLYYLEVAKFIHRGVNDVLPSTFDEFFRPIEHQHNTRTKLNCIFSLPRARTDLGKQSIKFSAVKVWSDLPPDIKSIEDGKVFGFNVKKFLLKGKVI